MSTVIKFLGMALSMANAKNDKGENIGKKNVKAIEEAHSMHPFASVTASYEGIGAIIAAKGLDPKNTNKEACSSRDNEVKALKRGYTAFIANSKKDPQEQIKKLYTWQEWKDKAGFTEEENAIISSACNGDPSYMFIYEDKNFIAYRVYKEEHGSYRVYIRESPFKSYNEVMNGIKKVYSNSKGQDGECKITYKMNEKFTFEVNFNSYLQANGEFVKFEHAGRESSLEEFLRMDIEDFSKRLKEAIEEEKKARTEANEKIEKEKKVKEEVKKAREGARAKVNSMTLEDIKAFEEWQKAREQNK